MGNCFAQMGDFSTAKIYFSKALEINPRFVDAHFNLGNTLREMKQYLPAIKCYQDALSLDSNLPHVHLNLGNTYSRHGSYREALAYYLAVETIYKDKPEFCFFVGCSYFGLRNFDLAIQWIRRAVEINHNFPDAYNELGRIYLMRGLKEEALIFYTKAYSLLPNNQVYLNNIINLLIQIGDYSRAYEFVQKIECAADKLVLMQCLLSLLCKWDDLKEVNDSLLKMSSVGRLTGWDLLRITDSAEVQFKFMKNFSPSRFPLNLKLGTFFARNSKPKIKVGYFSPDFRSHAVMHLSEEIYKLHDRAKFEIHAFSFYPLHSEKDREELSKTFDYFYEVNAETDFDIALKSRDLGIDIAIDLAGNTNAGRSGIFALRAAPVQINFLGYTGTMGSDYHDYIVVDPVIVPKNHQKFYTEKCIYLNSFMPRKVSLMPSRNLINRAMFNLPQEGFIFCCFNRSLKITPDVFESWMRILKAVPQSCLWFNTQPDEAVINLKKAAEKMGVDSTRLVFSSPVVDMTLHLARHRLAGLFLDTYPYNAHTTASDALWSGLPVITRPGNSFASRVSASLLTALDMSELITLSVNEYENLAIRLALNSEELSALKHKLKYNIKNKRLFNMKMYMREYEEALTQAHARFIHEDVPSVINVTQNNV